MRIKLLIASCNGSSHAYRKKEINIQCLIWMLFYTNNKNKNKNESNLRLLLIELKKRESSAAPPRGMSLSLTPFKASFPTTICNLLTSQSTHFFHSSLSFSILTRYHGFCWIHTYTFFNILSKLDNFF